MTDIKEGIEVNVEPLRKNHLYICTPAYGGQMAANYAHSMMALQRALLQWGIPHTISNMSNESLIPRARNRFANQFLQTDATHLLFIDSDIEFQPTDVLTLLHMDKDIIGAPYAMKKLRWDRIKEAAQKHPDISPEDLELCGADWSSHLETGKHDLLPFVPVECAQLATGFMLIKRNVFETLKPIVDHYESAPNEPGMTKTAEDYFYTGVHGNEYESEDYGFCRLWQEQGGKVYICPWIHLNHYGTYGFKGNMLRSIQLLGTV